MSESVTPRTIGPYSIVRLLGQGGMGVVYAGRDARGRLAAVKTLHAPSMDRAGAIRREIQALARLAHPGIVRIVEHGDHEGLPWYAMELCEGISLRDRMRGRCAVSDTADTIALGRAPWWDTTFGPVSTAGAGTAASPVPEGDLTDEPVTPAAEVPPAGMLLTEAITIAARICEPLAHVHGAGLVHRDLKPENVVLRPGGAPVLVDFGLASPWGGAARDRVAEGAGGVAGTAAYMSPEQCRGEIVDARTDLYALGCILYELLAGRPPFLGDSAGDVLAMQLYAEPEPPSRHGADLPPELDELVLGLLAKEPRDRIGYADTVAAALVELGASAPADLHAQPYLYRPPVAGRDAEMAALATMLEELLARGGSPLQAVVIGGESGVGKTRLLSELMRMATLRRVRVIAAECAPDGRTPLAAFRPALRALADRCRERQGPLPEALEQAAGVLAPYEPALAGIGPSAGAAPVDLPVSEASSRLFRALAGALGALLGDGATLLVIDDLQWADDLSVAFCARLLEAGAPAGTRLALACGYRIEETTPAIARLAEARSVRRLALRRIGRDGVAAMVRDSLALGRTPEAFVDLLTRHSEGNPFFVAEYLRSAVAERYLVRDARGAWRLADAARALVEDDATTLPLPASVRELVVRRLAMVDERSRRIAELAAVLGRESERPLLVAAMVLLGESLALDAVAALGRRGLLDEAPDGTLRFSHDKVREVVLQGTGLERLRALHRAVARAAETLHGGRERWLAEIARHWDEGDVPEKAAPRYGQAALSAVGKHALGDAERLFRAQLRTTGAASAASVAARLDLVVSVLDPLGRMAEAEETILAALDVARATGERRGEAEGLRQLASVMLRTGRVVQARELALRSLEWQRELGDRGREGSLQSLLGAIAQDTGATVEAWDRFEAALALHRAAGEERSAGNDLASMALLAQQQGLVAKATRLFEEALATASRSGALWLEGVTLGNLGLLHQAAGRMAQARGAFERALAIHREVGSRRFEGGVIGNLGKLHLDQGRLDEAEELLREASEIHELVGNRTHGAVALANLALVDRARGRLEESRARSGRAIAVFEELGDLQRAGNRKADLARTLQELGLLEEARRVYLEALGIARQVGNRQREGIVLRDLAGLQRLEGTADVVAGAKLLDDAEAILVAAGEDAELLELDCERGHAALASGASAATPLARAERRLAELGAQPESLRGLAVARLRRAQASFDADGPLRLGMAPEDLPAGLRYPDRGCSSTAAGDA